MNNTIKIIIAGGAGLGAFFIYKAIKKAMDEKEEKEKIKAKLEADLAAAKKAEEEAKSKSGGSSSGKSATKINEPTEYDKKVVTLQTLLQISTQGGVGKQTLGTLDYWWSSTGDTKTIEERKAGGYANLVTNGKGVLNSGNIDYYIDTFKAANSPRHNFNKTSAQNTANAAAAAKAAQDAAARKIWGEARFKDGAAGRAVKLRSGSLDADIYKYDYGLKKWLKTGEEYTFTTSSPNHLFAAFSKEGYTDVADQKAENTPEGFYILKNKATGKVVITNPYNFSAF